MFESSSSLHSAQAILLLFLFHLSTTYLHIVVVSAEVVMWLTSHCVSSTSLLEPCIMAAGGHVCLQLIVVWQWAGLWASDPPLSSTDPFHCHDDKQVSVASACLCIVG